MEVIGAITSVMALVHFTSALIKNVKGHLLREELGWFEKVLISLERTLGDLSVACEQSRQKKTSGLIESMKDLRIAVDRGKAVVEEVLSKKNVKVFFLIRTYRKKIVSVGLEIERALNGIRNSGVVITVELRQSMKETRGLTEELYDKVEEILFDMKENQEDILEQFNDVKALLRLVISNGYAQDKIDLDHQLQSIAQDADFIQSEKEFMDEVILQKVIEISKHVGTQIDENESMVSSKSNIYDHLLTCPLSLDVMEDPVIMNGYTYDRKHLCKSLLTYPNLDPVTNTRFDERASYYDNIISRQLLMQEKGDAAYKKHDDSYFAEAYERAWDNNMGSMFGNPAVPRERVSDLYQKIDEYLHGMNIREVDMEKAYETISDAPNSESNAILNFWKGCFVDTWYSRYKSSRVEKNRSRANAFYQKALDLDIEGMAEAGDIYAQVCLGEMYEYGYGVNRNDSTAVELYRKAAEQDYAIAQYNLGYMYDFGHGVDKNLSRAVEWYRKAAEQGHAAAQCNLGVMYEYGYGVDKNKSTAVTWYRKAAEQGHADAQYKLNRLTESLRKKKTRRGVKINNYVYEIRMIELDEYLYGMNRQNIDMEKAYDIITNSESNAILNFWKGRFADPKWRQCKSSRVEKNQSRANAFYQKAVDLDIEGMADAGDKYAQACLGWMYHFGDGVNRNYSRAVTWYRKAAEQGHADAQCNLGWMYYNGWGVDQNKSTAVEWTRKAAEQGHAYAQYYLGYMYENGQGVDKNLSRALEWYRKAVEQGHAYAQRNLDRLT